MLWIVVVVLTLLSGICDSQGFIHAARIWSGGDILWREVGMSALGYASGITIYWITLRFAQEVGILSPEAQTIGWFTATIVGVAIASRELFRWRAVDQGIAAAIVVGLVVLIYRTGA